MCTVQHAESGSNVRRDWTKRFLVYGFSREYKTSSVLIQMVTRPCLLDEAPLSLLLVATVTRAYITGLGVGR